MPKKTLPCYKTTFLLLTHQKYQLGTFFDKQVSLKNRTVRKNLEGDPLDPISFEDAVITMKNSKGVHFRLLGTL